MRDLQRPGFRFRLPFRPGFGTDDAGPIRRHIHPALHAIPGFGRHGEWRGNLEPLLIGTDFQFTRIAFQRDQIALIDDPDFRFAAAVPIRHQVGLEGVVLHIRTADEGGGALEKDRAEGFVEDLVALQFTHFPLKPAPDPRERRIGEFHAGIRQGVLGRNDGFEILTDRKCGKNPAADHTGGGAAGGFEGPRALLGGGGGGQFSIRPEGGIQSGFHLRGGRDEGLPLHFLDLAGGESLGINPAHFEGLAVAGMQDHFLRHDLK